MGAALRQRCLIHRCRNVLAKVSKNAQAEVKADYWAIFEVPEDIDPGLDAVAYVQKTHRFLRRPLARFLPGRGAMPAGRPRVR